MIMIQCLRLICIHFWGHDKTQEYTVGLYFHIAYLQMDLLQEFYETTLDALKDAKNDRLWFKTNTKVW